jgi:hypothetical protein
MHLTPIGDFADVEPVLEQMGFSKKAARRVRQSNRQQPSMHKHGIRMPARDALASFRRLERMPAPHYWD